MRKCRLILLMLACLGILVSCSGKNDMNEKDTTSQAQVETFDIETVYGNLTYPERWKEQLRIAQQEDEIQFFGTVKGKEEKLLFTLGFGKSEGYLLGTLDDIDLYIIDAETEFGDDWTDDEKEQIISMQEDFNVILDGLLSMDNFHLAK